jgi:hypothetical protein
MMMPMVYLTGAFLVVIVFVPSIWQVWKEYRNRTDLGPAAVQRYLLWRMAKIVSGILTVLIIVRMLLPAGLGAYRFVAGHWLLPSYSDALEVGERRLSSVANTSPDDSWRKESTLSDIRTIHDASMRSALAKDADGTPWEQQAYSFAVAGAVWLLCLTLLCYFVLPLFFLGNPLHAALFLVIAGIAYAVEEVLEALAPGWFFLPRGSWVAIALVIMLLLISVVLSDWLYEESKERYRLCHFCQHEMKASDSFCPRCGGQHVLGGDAALPGSSVTTET